MAKAKAHGFNIVHPHNKGFWKEFSNSDFTIVCGKSYILNLYNMEAIWWVAKVKAFLKIGILKVYFYR